METMVKMAQESYESVVKSADSKWGPTDTKVRLMTEMQDLQNLMSVS